MRGRVGRVAAAAVAYGVIGGLAVTVPAAAGPATRCADAGSRVVQVPWAQQLLNPAQAWPFSTGAGVTVAVVDTGVDAGQPRLRGHVERGTDVVDGTAGDSDCAGHGTQVAGIIAGQPAEGTGFEGFAPGATILPVKVVSDQLDTSVQGTADPAALAAGINWAAARHPGVIVVPLVSYQDSDALRAAVSSAIDHDVVVVAAAGDGGSEGDPTPYPAAQQGVLAVSGIAPDVTATDATGFGGYVGLAAPAAGVVAPQRRSGLVAVDGTAYAAGFVAATAALVRAQSPQLHAGQVIARLEATASPAPERAGDSVHYGHGIVDPDRAVTEQLTSASPRALPGLAVPQRKYDAAWWSSRHLALLLTGGAVLLALALVALGLVLPRARRRQWRTGLAVLPADDPYSDEPTPTVQLFKDA